MNKDKAFKILGMFGNPKMITPNGVVLEFARQKASIIPEIEKLNDDELVKEWKSLVWLNHIYGQVSLSELQHISLLELEMNERKNINSDELESWFNNTKEVYAVQEQQEIDDYNKNMISENN